MFLSCNKHIVRHFCVPSLSKMILAATPNFENITSLASQDWWMISSSCQFTEFKIKLTLGKLFFTKNKRFLLSSSILMMHFLPSTYLLHSRGSFSWHLPQSLTRYPRETEASSSKLSSVAPFKISLSTSN